MESVFRKSRRQVTAVTWGKPHSKASCYALSQILGGFVLLAVGGMAFGADVDNELLSQQQRERARQLREDKTSDVRLDASQGLSTAGNIPTDERPCFSIECHWVKRE
jgi:hemolysin activation/secretion protein